jgi:hypothetical protein
MVTYVKGNHSFTWHWCKNCTQYPPIIYEDQSNRPTYDLCNECKTKEKKGECKIQRIVPYKKGLKLFS